VELAQLNYMMPAADGARHADVPVGRQERRGDPEARWRSRPHRRARTAKRTGNRPASHSRPRVGKIQDSINEVRKQRALRRASARNAVPLERSRVGYTNAGKSTLFNALSRAEVLVSSRMFATLDRR